MEIPRRTVREYIYVSQLLLKVNDLTNAEIDAVQEMVGRISKKFDSNDDPIDHDTVRKSN